MADISLDQWQSFVAVVTAGSYSRAAEQLHKSQSTVTYAIQKIEDLLSVKLFEIEGRKAVLTKPGRALFDRASVLVDEANRIERVAAGLAAGWEPELRIAVDALFPTWLMLDCIREFTIDHPDVRVELFESVLDGTNELLTSGQVEFAITSEVPPGFLGDRLMDIDRIAVAAPSHELHRTGAPISADQLRAHRHILIRDSGRTRSRNPSWQGSHQRLVVSQKATAIRGLCLGLGYAWVASDIVREELIKGHLKPLPLTEGAARSSTLYLVHADGQATGPGIARMEEIIRRAVDASPDALA